MKNLFILVLIISASFILSCKTQKFTLVFYSTTVEKISTLKVGMSKETVSSKLGIFPYEIFQNQKNGCEIHQFKYKRKQREYSAGNQTNEQGLNDGAPKYVEPGNLYLIYRNNQLESYFTDMAEADGFNVLFFNGEIKQFCDNPGFNLFEEEVIKNEPEVDKDCDYCDIIRTAINKGKSNVTINLPPLEQNKTTQEVTSPQIEIKTQAPQPEQEESKQKEEPKSKDKKKKTK